MLFDDKSTMLYDEKSSISYTSAKDLGPEIYSVASSSSTSQSLPSEWALTKTKKSLFKSTLYITTSSGTPHHAVSTHCGHSGVTIHTTNDQASEPLITARRYLGDFDVRMPSHNINLKASVRWRFTTHPTVQWDMIMPHGGVEHFEWANSRGSWKLTRRSAAGEEDVVAKWHFSYCSSRLSGDFECVGAGASGELGETFQYVAAAIALAIGKVDRDTNMAVLAGTSS
ncbi:hypothetical protein M409DRAFT_30859 [Zasmidium cellare ATCC 36951]|uniref:Uncharacterized protein n=1 Tax=Zasmidium cellare ATCC 36951 TaxID=1080233 RepID=A0A6A6BV18_ZASCE|nr:uncharacterized protein M409DRAFT_30859 [Zasmidium cellare ATCC 36951]KAF2158634.1 hypothetical protein M409DRAFT_30859 [Zasmidium cellare ATCC 36951]